MSKPDPDLPPDLLSALEPWQDRLTAAYFDPEARRQAIGDLRTWLGERQAAEHLQAVVRRLVGEASRRAAPPAPEQAAAPLLSGADLEDRIITAYPYPVATPYRALTEQES